MTTLLNLPVLPKDRDCAAATSIILDTYIKERDNINNPNELIEFIKRWKNIWLLSEDSKPEVIKLTELNFDSTIIFDLLVKMTRDKSNDFDFDSENTRIAANIAIPPSTLDVVFLSKHFGVGTDLIFVRLYLDPYPEHEMALRY